MGHLYIDSKGREKKRHSYSAGLEFDQCAFKFYLKRVIGWREKDTKAALLFGRAIEDAVQFHHEAKGQGGEAEFERLWIRHVDNDKLIYTKTERNWENLMRAGKEMLRLYAIRLPSLPIPLDTRFQREFVKEVFPGDPRLGGIEFFGKLDMISYTDPHHPLLKSLPWDLKWGLTRPLIIDMKTSGVDFDDTIGIVAQDIQLRTYAWLTGIFDVAFLWFKKNGHELKKGTSVTLLEQAGAFLPGDEAVVAYISKEGQVFLVRDDVQMEEMHKAQGRKESGDLDTTKAASERKMAWLAANCTTTTAGCLTRQRLQFSNGRVSHQSAADAGQIAANQIARIVNAWETNQWPNTFGIRYPHDDRRDPFFQAFVLKDNVFRDAIFEKAVDDYESDDEVEAQLDQEAV